MKFISKKLLLEVLISGLFGCLLFLFVYGPEVLNPNYVDWIVCKSNDFVQHYLGWEFFRRAEWTFPLGIFNNLSYPLNASIIYTDSIPLFAVIFKIFTHAFPNTFQYWGIWGLLCFMLQPILGTLIVRKFTKNDVWGSINAILAGILFALVPYLFVALFWHSSLIAHWIILLSFIPLFYYKDLNLGFKFLLYFLIGLFSASIHPYFIITAGITMFISNLYLYFKYKDKNIVFCYLVYLSSIFITLYLLGFFSCNYINTANNLLLDTFNLNGFFNPFSAHFAYLMPVLKYVNPHQFMGYAYYGVGLLFLPLVSVVILFIPKLRKIETDKFLISVFFLGFFISLLLALSPQITLNDKIIFEYKLPDYIFNLWSVYRGTGRFIYAAFYILLILAFYFLNTKINSKILSVILSVSICLQIIDSSILYTSTNEFYKDPVKTTNSEDEIYLSFWNNLILNNKIKVVFLDEDLHFYGEVKKEFIGKNVTYFNETLNKSYLGGTLQYNLAYLFRDKDIKMNNFYFARNLKDTEKVFNERLKNPQDTDLFLFFTDVNKDKLKNSKLKHFYRHECILLGSTKNLNGLKKSEVTIDNL